MIKLIIYNNNNNNQVLNKRFINLWTKEFYIYQDILTYDNKGGDLILEISKFLTHNNVKNLTFKIRENKRSFIKNELFN